MFDNIKTNTIAFGGFVEYNSTIGSSTFTVKNVNISNSVFDSPDSLIITQKYSYTGLAQFTLTNSLITNLTFNKFGNVILLTHNSKTPVLI